MSDSELQTALRDLERAIRDAGRMPQYHREVMARHRREWPTLWEAIDRVLSSNTPHGSGLTAV